MAERDLVRPARAPDLLIGVAIQTGDVRAAFAYMFEVSINLKDCRPFHLA